MRNASTVYAHIISDINNQRITKCASYFMKL